MNDKEKEGALAHEKGSGAPCLKCGPKCAGLDLHFWRKTCKNCRCKEEDHKVTVQKFDIQKSILETIFPNSEDMIDNQKSQSIITQPGLPVSFGTQTTPSEEHAKKFPPQQDASTKTESSSTSVPEEAESSFPDPPQDLTLETVQPPDLGTTSIEALVDFALSPDGSKTDTLTRYIDSIPKEKSPHASEEGRQYHQKQMIQQLPAHDFDENLCDDLTDGEKEKMQEFNKKRSEEASGKGAVQEQAEIADKIKPCVNCNEKFKDGDVVIFADRAGSDKRWHPECFVCYTCKELLVDLIYFFKDENIYCGRHYGELTGLRCAACDELIFTQEYTIADGKNYHLKHFCCYECDKELGGESYVPKDDHPYCMACYRVKFAKTCHGCQKGIPPDDQCLSYEDCYWHANEVCFSCCVCKANLVGQQFIFRDNKAFCSAECIGN